MPASPLPPQLPVARNENPHVPPSVQIEPALRLTTYGLEDHPLNQESYCRAREIGQTHGMPAHNFDATLLFSLDSGSAEENAKDSRHWRRLSEARRFGIPRRWVPGDYQKPVYNQFSLGRQAYLLGLADGAGQRVPIYTVTYEARVADLVRQVPAFAQAVLGIEPEELRRLSDTEIRSRIRSAPNIFTVQDHMIAVEKAFGQFQQNPQAMTADHWDVAMREAADPRASHTKSPAYLRLAGKTELARTFETFGMVDDHPKVARVVSEQPNGRVVEVERPKGFTYKARTGIQPTLDRMTSDNSTNNVLDALERLPSLPKGTGRQSVTKTGIPTSLPNPPSFNTTDYVVTRVSSTELYETMLSTKAQAIEIMDRSLLEGRRPFATRGFVSMAEMGASMFIARSLVGREMNWQQTAPDLLIFSVLGFLGGLFGKFSFCRGVPINFLLPLFSTSLVQLYHGQEITPVHNLLTGMLFSGLHSIAYEKISQPYIIARLRLPILAAYQSGNLLKARAMHLGLLRGGVWMVGFVASTAVLTLSEWLGEC